jgi:hypothetical protein
LLRLRAIVIPTLFSNVLSRRSKSRACKDVIVDMIMLY